MGPIGSKVIEVKGQIYVFFLLVMFFSVCSPTSPRSLRSLGRSSPNLEGRWRAAPDISLRGSFFERSRSSRSKVKFFCWSCFFFCLFPYFSQVLKALGPNFTKLGGKVEGGPDISSRGSFFKGQGHRGQRSNFCISAVLGPICMKLGECIQVESHRGQRSNLFFFLLVMFFFSVCSPTSPRSLRSLGRSLPNLEGRWRTAPDISLRGSFLEGQGHRGQRSNLCFFSVCSPTSPRSLGQSSPNLVGRLRATPDISSRGSFFKVKVIEVKGQISVSGQSLVRFA